MPAHPPRLARLSYLSAHLRHAWLALILSAAFAPKAAAQWSASIDVGAARFWGGSRDIDGTQSFRPYRPTLLGFGLERSASRLGLGLHGYHAAASLALEASDAVVAVGHALDLYGIALEGSIAVMRLGPAAALVTFAGPVVERWTLAGQGHRTVIGADAGLGLRIVLGHRWTGLLRAGLGAAASPFRLDDLEAGFSPRTLWRREIDGRVAYRF